MVKYKIEYNLAIMKKWVFLTIWLVCVTIFVAGQIIAPPHYYDNTNSLWGTIFGTSLIIGIVAFGLSVFSFYKDLRKSNNLLSSKFDLSIKRIISRLFIAGALGIVFGIAMLPFLTIADGLLYEQRAQIGNQNISKMIVLWGLFTLIVSLYAFWRKHLRMVSVILILCWIVSLVFYLALSSFQANSYACKRTNPYQTNNEINRALDLISQRMSVDSNGRNTIWQTIFNYRNCIDVQYETVNNDVEGYFLFPKEKDQKSLQHLKVFINPYYKNLDDLSLATLLSHELVHVGQYINEVANIEKLSCYEKEAKAFAAEQAFFISLNPEEQRSIYTRLSNNIYENPAISMFLSIGEKGNEAAQACLELQMKNNLTDEQTINCSWEGLQNKLLKEVKENIYYQKQCSDTQ